MRMQFHQESLCSFLNSSVNVEYVYLILTGVHKFLIEGMEEQLVSSRAASQANSNFKLARLVIQRNEKTTKIRM